MSVSDGTRDVLSSAAGLRPASAFIAIGAVLVAVAGRAVQLALFADGVQPEAEVQAAAPWPEFEIVDRIGRPLALSVECFDVTVSPRALWRSHTPARIALAMAEALEADDAEGMLLARMLPAQAERTGGWITPEEPELLRFEGEGLERVRGWLDGHALGAERAGLEPLAGFELVPLPGQDGAAVSDGNLPDHGGAWTLAWSPAQVLSADERTRQIGEQLGRRPERWTTRLLGDLALLVRAAGLPADVTEDLERLVPSERGPRLRDLVWNELCPTTYRLVARRVDPVLAHSLAQVLREESVSPWQVQLVPRLERRHPARPADVGVLAMGEGGAQAADPFAVMGHWGVLGAGDAERQARSDLANAPHLLDWDQNADPLLARAGELGRRWRPWSGLEKLCSDVLETARHELPLDESPRSLTKRERNVSRDRRSRWPDRVPNYFVESSEGAPVPLFHSTLDAGLQRMAHDELLGVLEEFDSALAMGIAVDVESGEVLSIDGVQAYDSKWFAPTQHVFTPGSTMKAIIMAMALDRGLVHPDEEIQTFAPLGYRVRSASGKGRVRLIREALGAPTEPWITASQGLAQSVNAVLVQVGLRMDAADLRAGLVQLGYGARPGAGLGPERVGHLRRLDKGTWKRRYTHASVSFGHEIGVTLWQHAAALATLVRGGEALPLRMLRGLSQGDDGWDLRPGQGERVLSERACAQVRTMMALGAAEGTGRRVAHPEMHPEFHYLGTKTGTTEKVESEICIHVELAHALDHEADKTRCSKSCRSRLRGQRDHKGLRNTCYTSSMMAVGQLEPGGRQILVLVVVDDARSKAKFGADVAGRAAVRILRRAFELPPDPAVERLSNGPALSAQALSQTELPWFQDAAEAYAEASYAEASEGEWGEDPYDSNEVWEDPVPFEELPAGGLLSTQGQGEWR